MAADTAANLDTGKTKKTAKKSSSRSKSRASAKKTRTSTKKPVQSSAKALHLDPRTAALPSEVAGLLCLVSGLAILLAIVSFQPADLAQGATTQNLIGPVGARVADMLLLLFGLGSLCFDLVLWYLGLMLLIGRPIEWKPTEIGGQLLFVLASTILAHLSLDAYLFFSHEAGGVIGAFVGELLRGLFGTVGTYLIACCMLILSLMLVTSMSLSAITRAILSLFHRGFAYSRHRWRVHREYRARLVQERQRLLAGSAPIHDLEAQARQQAELAIAPIGQEEYAFEQNFEEQVEHKLSGRLQRLFRPRGSNKALPIELPSQKKSSEDASSQDESDENSEDSSAPESTKKDAKESTEDQKKAPTIKKRKARRGSEPTPPAPPQEPPAGNSWELGELLDVSDSEPQVDEAGPTQPEVDEASSNTLPVEEEDVIDMKAEREASSELGDDDFGPRIVESSAKSRAERIKQLLAEEGDAGVLFKPQKRGNFELPKIHFLDYEDSGDAGVDVETLREMATQIEETLRNFKVDGQVKDICPGPVITVFEFSPAPGVKISKIANLSDDLAMALSALSVRIVAPIPGKGVVGIEVPNPSREMVYMKEIIADDVFHENTKMALPMGLGKDTEGNPIVTDLAKMPHLLVAGATGSGKSVAVNTMITSLLYQNSPDDVRLIMVDPKMLEFSIYADIPHLLLPVVTDPKQATVALNWAVQEMERRYQALADMGVRNIKGYNTKVDKLTTQAEADMREGLDESKAISALGIDANGTPDHKRLPYIVVIIDEFADLMMTASKEVETAVARLAQKARAAGIHLILATQRPSTDVITGLIKANFPTRIALRVTSKTDSRVILDSNGAENLLGNGDMLFVPPGTSHIQRVHGAYISEKEIDKIVEFLREQGDPQYDDSILVEESEDGGGAFADEDRDEHYEDAVRLVCEADQASISMIQRKLRVGYNRAARMVEMMEGEGIVSAPDGCKPREVIVDTCPY